MLNLKRGNRMVEVSKINKINKDFIKRITISIEEEFYGTS